MKTWSYSTLDSEGAGSDLRRERLAKLYEVENDFVFYEEYILRPDHAE